MTVSGARMPTKLVLNVAVLQRIALRDLQQRIAIHVVALKNHPAVFVKKEESCLLIDLLRRYSKPNETLENVTSADRHSKRSTRP
jgi:hypothetical protein